MRKVEILAAVLEAVFDGAEGSIEGEKIYCFPDVVQMIETWISLGMVGMMEFIMETTK